MSELTLEPQAVPLSADQQGVLRVGGTRVRLETVVNAFLDGATPEEIVLNFDVLQLADVYGVISYYLKHRKEVDNYLQRQDRKAVEIQQEWQSRSPQRAEFKQLLLSRLAAKEQRDAAPGQ